MPALDTKVLVRYIVQDDPLQFRCPAPHQPLRRRRLDAVRPLDSRARIGVGAVGNQYQVPGMEPILSQYRQMVASYQVPGHSKYKCQSTNAGPIPKFSHHPRGLQDVDLQDIF
jgi:hypothetical protein